MEKLSRSASKKPYTSNGFGAKTVYDDVFGGPPKFGVPTLSPRVEDYTEIFGGFHASRASSIPILDLPAADQTDFPFDVRSSHFDYSEVFGGFNGLDIAVSFEELFNSSKATNDSSSDEAWTPAQSETFSDESDLSACGDRNQSYSNGESYQSCDGIKQFNVSYNKVSQRSKEDISNGMAHVTQLHAVPGFTYVVNETPPPQKIEDMTTHLQVTDDLNPNTDFNRGLREGRRFRKTMSHPSNSSFGIQTVGIDLKPVGYGKTASHVNEAFLTVSDFSLRTQPSDLPPPSRPPPGFSAKDGGLDVKKPKLKVSRSFAFGEMGEDSSPAFFDVEIDASSSAAVSAAAMKDAMEKAQAKLKFAKELMERKKEGPQSRTKLGFMNDTKDKGVKASKTFDGSNSFTDESAHGTCQRDDSGMKTFAGEERQKVMKTKQVVSDSIEGEKYINMAKISSDKKHGKEYRPSQESFKSEGTVAWREAEQFYEVVETDKSRKIFEAAKDDRILAQNAQFHEHGHEKKATKATPFQLQEGDNRKIKADREARERDRNKGRSKATKDSSMQDEKEAEVNEEICKLEENGKKPRMGQQHGAIEKIRPESYKSGEFKNLPEVLQKDNEEEIKGTEKMDGDAIDKDAFEREEHEKRRKETLERERYEKRLKAAIERAAIEKRLKEALDWEEREKHREREEKEKREKEAREREDKEKRLKEAHKIEENEKRIKEAREREENEKRLKKARDIEENEKRIKEAREREENEKRLKEARDIEENEKRIKEAREREENEKRLKEVRKRAENEKRLKEASEREENVKRIRKVREREENEKRLKEAREREENEKRLKEVREREEIEKRLEEALEQEENKKRLKEALEQEENENRLKIALGQEENEKKQKLAQERDEHVKRLVENRRQEEIGKKLRGTPQHDEIANYQKGAHEKEKNEERPTEACGWEEKEKRLQGAWQQEDNKKRLQKTGERKESEKGSQEACKQKEIEKRYEANECEKTHKRTEDAGYLEELKGRNEYHEQNQMDENERKLKSDQGTYLQPEGGNLKASDGGSILDDYENQQPAQAACKQNENSVKAKRTRGALSFEEDGTMNAESIYSEENAEAAEVSDVMFEGQFNSAGMAQADLHHELNQNGTKDATESLHLQDTLTESVEGGLGIGQANMDRNKKPLKVGSNLGKPNVISCKLGGRGTNVKEIPLTFDKEEIKEKSMSSQVFREHIENGRKLGAVQPTVLEGKANAQSPAQKVNTEQNTERKEKNFKDSLAPEERHKEERIKRERELEKERLRKIEEEREREREREKDRMAVDRATLEARERVFSEAHERAERAAVERATAEVRQRVMADARERLEKASAEARERSFAEKANMEARLRAERAAVERATTEARERAAVERATTEARERAFQKAMTEKAVFEARERVERSVADKSCASYKSGGIRQNSSFSDLPDAQFRGVGSSSIYSYSSVHGASYNTERVVGVEGESPQRSKARLERHQRTAERAAKALAEKNMRDLLAQREQAERNRLAEALDAEVKRWSSGKEGNLRALLSTLQYILGHDSGWQPIPLTEVITSAACKKAYRKATLCVHPDKLQQRGASIQQKYICEKVFDLLKEAWNKFNSEER